MKSITYWFDQDKRVIITEIQSTFTLQEWLEGLDDFYAMLNTRDQPTALIIDIRKNHRLPSDMLGEMRRQQTRANNTPSYAFSVILSNRNYLSNYVSMLINILERTGFADTFGLNTRLVTTLDEAIQVIEKEFEIKIVPSDNNQDT